MNNSICSRPWLIVFSLSKEKEKETKRRALVYQPFAGVDVVVDAVDQKRCNQKVRETVCFAKILNPGWEGVKSIPKTGQSFFEDPDSCCGVGHQQCGGIL